MKDFDRDNSKNESFFEYEDYIERQKWIKNKNIKIVEDPEWEELEEYCEVLDSLDY